MAYPKITRHLGTSLAILLLAGPVAHADGGCAGRATSLTGNNWSTPAGEWKPLRPGDCIRVSERVKTGNGASGVIRVNGFGDLGVGGATEVRFDEYDANPSHRALSVLTVALLAGTASYASDFFMPSAAARIMLPRLGSSVHVADGAVRIVLHEDHAVLQVSRGQAQLAGPGGARLDIAAPASVFMTPGGRWQQRKNPEEIPCSSVQNEQTFPAELHAC